MERLNVIFGWVASLTFGGVSLVSAILTALQVMTAVVGLCGAVLGLVGAYYTVRIQRRAFRNKEPK